MKKVLFDTNIILDVALKRDPYFESAMQLFNLIDHNIISASITASTITDIYYISKKEKGHAIAIQFISNIIEIVDVLRIDKSVIENALIVNFKDFEDAIQVSSAEMNDLNAIITRNKKDFESAQVSIYTPDEFLGQFSGR